MREEDGRPRMRRRKKEGPKRGQTRTKAVKMATKRTVDAGRGLRRPGGPGTPDRDLADETQVPPPEASDRLKAGLHGRPEDRGAEDSDPAIRTLIPGP